jgi:hypothetical protein
MAATIVAGRIEYRIALCVAARPSPGALRAKQNYFAAPSRRASASAHAQIAARSASLSLASG